MGDPTAEFLATFDGQMLVRELEELSHAIQTGVLFTRNHDLQKNRAEDLRETGPKHLRVGVNTAHCNHSALARLLIRKGVITPKEYFQACVDELRAEKVRYEKALSDKHGGIEIHLQ